MNGNVGGVPWKVQIPIHYTMFIGIGIHHAGGLEVSLDTALEMKTEMSAIFQTNVSKLTNDLKEEKEKKS